MPFSTNNKIQIVDESGDPVVLGSGAVTTETLRVTIATDDPHWGTVGTAADAEGTAHGQLRFIGDVTSNVNTNLASLRSDVGSTNTLLGTIDTDTGNMVTALQIIDDWDATQNSAVPTDGVAIMGEAKFIDGSALPNSVGEGNAA